MSSDRASRRDFLRMGAAGLVVSRTASLDGLLSIESQHEAAHRSKSTQQYQLNIQLSGLCMFVNHTPAPPKDSSLVSVLMPRAGTPNAGWWGRQVPALHRAAVYFDIAHLTPGATQPEGCYVRYPLDRCGLDLGITPSLTNQCPAGSAVTYPGEIVDIPATFSDRPLHLVKGLFDKVPPPWVASRLDLSAGCFSPVTAYVNFGLHGLRKDVANIAEWTVPGVQSLSSWKLQPYDVTVPPVFLPPLNPIGNEINILIYNVISEEEPDWSSVKPTFWETDDQKYQHFLAYYDFFDYQFTGNDDYTPHDPKAINGGGGPNPYTCMLAGGGGH